VLTLPGRCRLVLPALGELNLQAVEDGLEGRYGSCLRAPRRTPPTEVPPDYPPAAIGLLRGDGDEYLLEGGLKGQRGFSPATRAAQSSVSTLPAG
jgi:hypothetical protein